MFVGWSPTVGQLGDYLSRHSELGFTPIGYVEQAKQPNSPGTLMPYLGTFESLPELIEEYHPAWIVVANQEKIQAGWLEAFLELRFGGVHCELASSLYETTLGRVCNLEIRPNTLGFSESWRPDSLNLAIQSLYSKAVALVAMPVVLPILAAIALLMKVSSKGPVLLKEQRVGLYGAPFTLYRLGWRGGSSNREGRRHFKRFGLDMLPQFWNVLRGDLSIVGPQPDRPEFAERLKEAIPYYSQRNLVKPGMTGWAQIHRSENARVYDEMTRLEYDLYYVKNLSPSLDFSTMLLWLKEALSSRSRIVAQ